VVAGILIRRFGRSTSFQSAFADSMVAFSSCAISGETSMDTRPSSPPDASKTSASTSQAFRTSVVVRAKIASSIPAPPWASLLTWSS
jgi:hypothetical protein